MYRPYLYPRLTNLIAADFSRQFWVTLGCTASDGGIATGVLADTLRTTLPTQAVCLSFGSMGPAYLAVGWGREGRLSAVSLRVGWECSGL